MKNSGLAVGSAAYVSIFVGLMRNTTSQIRDVQGFNIWVMDKNVQFIDDLKHAVT